MAKTWKVNGEFLDCLDSVRDARLELVEGEKSSLKKICKKLNGKGEGLGEWSVKLTDYDEVLLAGPEGTRLKLSGDFWELGEKVSYAGHLAGNLEEDDDG